MRCTDHPEFISTIVIQPYSIDQRKENLIAFHEHNVRLETISNGVIRCLPPQVGKSDGWCIMTTRRDRRFDIDGDGVWRW